MSEQAEKEVERLKWMIQYALDGPDEAIRKILQDALDGKNGAEEQTNGTSND